jgi:hypothetical protein
LVLFGTSRR